jgi:cytochrome c oxidase cbb3-type subunit I/II
MMTETAKRERFHRRVLEGKAGLFAVVTTVAISIGGIVEIVPMFTTAAGPERPDWAAPYTPLEVAGRDIYIREGCYVCHSQMVRPMRAELLRYGEWSRAGEYRYDHPFQLGSRRIGPDVQRVGGKYPDAWHYEHMRDPRSMTPGSVMPPYAWLLERSIDHNDVQRSVRALKRLGAPYSDAEVENVAASIETQGSAIVTRLAEQNIQGEQDLEIVALIAYLQRLGRDGQRAIDAGLTAPTGGQ